MSSAGTYMESENYIQNVDALTCNDAKAWTYLTQFVCTPYNSTFAPPNPVTYTKIIINHIIKAPMCNSGIYKRICCTNEIQNTSIITSKLIKKLIN